MLRMNGGWLFVTVAMASLISAATAGAQGPRKSIGVMLQGDESGLRVANVLAGSPADKAGVKAGDQVVSVGGITVEQLDPDRMKAIMDTAKVIALVVKRDGKPLTFRLTPAMLTPPPMAPAPPSGNGASTRS